MEIKLLCAEDVPEKVFNKTIKKLKKKLPEDFIEFIKNGNGAYVTPSAIFVNDHEEMVNNFVSMDPESDAYILDYNESIGEKSIIPFARDAGDNYFAFKFYDDGSSIVFWDYELETIEPVCDSFSVFLSMLHEGEE